MDPNVDEITDSLLVSSVYNSHFNSKKNTHVQSQIYKYHFRICQDLNLKSWIKIYK